MFAVFRDLVRYNIEFTIGLILVAIVVAFSAASFFSPVDPSLIYGGVVNGLTFTTDGRKQGIPEHIWSLYLIYSFSEAVIKGLTATVGVTSVDSTYSGFSKAVKLPSYTLLNAGFNYETDSWKFGLQGRNLTNERYFRSNFPDLFGSSVVLPEVPRNWTMSMAYKF